LNHRKETNMSKRRRPTYPDAEARLRQALERLGTDNPKCAHCPETNPLLLERHHVAGQHYGEGTIIECVKCHILLSDMQKDHPHPIGDKAPSTWECMGHLLLGLADLLTLAADKLKETGQELINYAAGLRANTSPVEGGVSC
jgi:hypothetical protein